MDPWGTPDKTGVHSELDPLTTTLSLLFIYCNFRCCYCCLSPVIVIVKFYLLLSLPRLHPKVQAAPHIYNRANILPEFPLNSFLGKAFSIMGGHLSGILFCVASKSFHVV